MGDRTGIQWADATWNVINGCQVISPGCANCYAADVAAYRLKNHPSRVGLATPGRGRSDWSGIARFWEPFLDQPLKWRKPRRIFVCAHGDLFYERVPDDWIDQVFAVMMLAPQHQYLVLTKRAARMRDYMTSAATIDRLSTIFHSRLDALPKTRQAAAIEGVKQWPPRNIALGVSVEDQARANLRIPDLLATPAAMRFVSAEPLLGPVDLTALPHGDVGVNALAGSFWLADNTALDLVIVGGESGYRARPMAPSWARQIRDDCGRAGVPFFFKQWGRYADAVQYQDARGERSRVAGDLVVDLGPKNDADILDGYQWHDHLPFQSKETTDASA